jgi:hypothetical protein
MNGARDLGQGRGVTDPGASALPVSAPGWSRLPGTEPGFSRFPGSDFALIALPSIFAAA